MKPPRAFIARHPVLGYYALVFTISWGGILLLVAPGGIPGQAADVERLFPLALAALFAGPSIAGLVMTALTAGRAGLRALLHRMLHWRVDARWYAAALLTGPVLVAAVLLPLSRFSPEYRPGILEVDDPLGLVLFGLGAGLVGGGLLEELGWTGFAVPTLRQRHGPLQTGIIVGLLWGAWHLLIAFWSSGGLADPGTMPSFVGGFLAFYFLALPAFRVLMVRVHDRTGSLLLAMLMHAMLSASTLILQPLSTGASLGWNLALGVILWVIVLAVHLGQPRYSTPRPAE